MERLARPQVGTLGLQAVVGKDLVVDDWRETVRLRDPLAPATAAGLGNLSAWFDDAAIRNRFGGWTNVTRMPWYWDEACTASWYDLAAVSNVADHEGTGLLPAELVSYLVPCEMLAALDSVSGAGTILLTTKLGHGGTSAVVENRWRHDGAARDWTAYTRFGWDLVTGNDTAGIESVEAFVACTDASAGGTRWLYFNDTFSPGGFLRAGHDLREAPLFTVAELDAYIKSNGTAAPPARRLDGDGERGCRSPGRDVNPTGRKGKSTRQRAPRRASSDSVPLVKSRKTVPA